MLRVSQELSETEQRKGARPYGSGLSGSHEVKNSKSILLA
jgi:hypothetical protein